MRIAYSMYRVLPVMVFLLRMIMWCARVDPMEAVPYCGIGNL